MCSQHRILCQSGSLRRLVVDKLCSVHQHCSVFPRGGSVSQNRLGAPAPLRRLVASSAMDDTIKRRKMDGDMVPPLLEFAAARPRAEPPLQHTTGSSFKVPGLQVRAMNAAFYMPCQADDEWLVRFMTLSLDCQVSANRCHAECSIHYATG